jgi:sugar phosphate isomerase/epimerase
MLGLCSGSLAKTSVASLMEIAGAHGFASVMILPDAAPPPPERIRAIRAAHGIRRVILDGVLGMLPRCRFATDHGITADHHFRAAETYGVTHFNVPHYQGDPDTPQAEIVEGLKPFCDRAGRMGIAVSLEFLPGTGIPNIPGALEIIAAVNAPNLGLTVDTWHMARTGATAADIRALPPGIIRDFHLSDRAKGETSASDSFGRLLPGDGDLPLAEIVSAALANSPDLAIAAEVFSHDLQNLTPHDAAGRIGKAVRRGMAELQAA